MFASGGILTQNKSFSDLAYKCYLQIELKLVLVTRHTRKLKKILILLTHSYGFKKNLIFHPQIAHLDL